jgi:hypothetical protein
MKRTPALVLLILAAIAVVGLTAAKPVSYTPGFERVVATYLVPSTSGIPQQFTFTVQCPGGKVATGGGYRQSGISPVNFLSATDVSASYPDNASVWAVEIVAAINSDMTLDVYAVCANP